MTDEMMSEQNGALLSVRNLQVSFPTETRRRPASWMASRFDVAEGETLGIVGESGSGKSMTSLALLGMVPHPGAVTAGEIYFRTGTCGMLDERELRSMRGSQLAMIFQDPMTSLNPFLPVWVQIAEVTRVHLGYSRDRGARSRDSDVGGRGHSGRPCASEPISAPVLGRDAAARHDCHGAGLQSEAADRGRADHRARRHDSGADPRPAARTLKRKSQTALILITHDLGIVAENADRVLVMYAGPGDGIGPARRVVPRIRRTRTRARCCAAFRIRRVATARCIRSPASRRMSPRCRRTNVRSRSAALR